MEIGVEEQQVGDECPMSTSEEVAEKLEEKGQVDKRSNAKDMQHDNLG